MIFVFPILMKQEKSNYVILIIIFVAVATTLLIILNPNSQIDKEPIRIYSYEESLELARERIISSYQFKEYNGANLLLLENRKLECEDCWNFVFKFDVNTSPDGYQLPSRIKSFRMGVDVINGVAKNLNMTEVYDQNDSSINYCMPKTRNVEACTMEYNPVCGWFKPTVTCVKYPCAQTFGNPCLACKNELVESWTQGECPN